MRNLFKERGIHPLVNPVKQMLYNKIWFAIKEWASWISVYLSKSSCIVHLKIQ